MKIANIYKIDFLCFPTDYTKTSMRRMVEHGLRSESILEILKVEKVQHLFLIFLPLALFYV